jgi:hypothetical protein
MKKRKISLISLCLVILFTSFAEAQSVRLFKRNHKNPEDFYKPNEQGCRVSYISTLGNAKPGDLIEFFAWTYRNFSGKNGGIRVHYDCQPEIKNVMLSQTEIVKSCSMLNSLQNISCQNDATVEISVNAIDPEGDPLIYIYSVSGGKIIGNGSKVVWDLSDVKSGVYKVDIWADDGCGICGEPKTKEIKIIDCSQCRTNERY